MTDVTSPKVDSAAARVVGKQNAGTVSLSTLSASDASACTADRVGGKAAKLSAMTALGLPVPKWIVIEAVAWHRIMALPEMASALAKARTDPAPSSVLESALLNLVQSNDEIRGQLSRIWTDMDCASIAVRSSAIGEDGADHSYAGQFETVLGVSDAGALIDAVCRCWASAWSDRVIAYRARHNLDPFDISMAVVLQKMVAADTAGVMFGADPTSGDPDTVVVSATWGIGETLVSGIANADTYWFSRDGEIRHEVAEKDIELKLMPDGTTTELKVEGARLKERALTDQQVASLAEIAYSLERDLGAPQDIEWAFESGELFILQTRPITTRVRPRGSHRLWDNSNIVESYSGIVYPLTFSFARDAYRAVYDQFVRVVGVRGKRYEEGSRVFDQMLGYIDGRVYYNLRNWYVLISMLPGYKMNQRFMEQMMGVREAPDPRLLPDPPSVGKVRDFFGLVEAAFRLWWNIRRLKKTIPPFRALVQRLQRESGDNLAEMHTDELVDHFISVREEALWNWRPPMVNDFGCMVAFGVLGGLVTKYGMDDTGTLKNELLAGQGGVESTEPTHALVKMAAHVRATPELLELFQSTPDDELFAALANAPGSAAQTLNRDLDVYFEKYGDRCVNELKLETPTLRENPSFLFDVLRNFIAQKDLTVEAMESRERAVCEAAEQKVAAALKGHPIRKWWFGVWLRQTRERVKQRENLRFDRTRVFGVARRIMVEIGRRFHAADMIESPRDIFLLDVEEIIGTARGVCTTLDLKGLVQLRRAGLERAEAENPSLPDRIRTIGPALANPLEPESAAASIDGDAALGTGCCPGIVEKPVHIVHRPDQGVRIDGDIMVCERTDPGWVPLFPSCGGLLVERGSLLSHSAIVAREFGIPAIVGIAGLMEWARDGEVLKMDGSTGSVVRPAGEKSNDEDTS